MDEREEHERGLARFLVGEWRARFRESLAPAKRRDTLRSQLPHLTHLDPRFATPVQQSASELGAQLREKGAGGRCYLLSEDPELDGREIALDEALVAIVDGASQHATFVSCLPGHLAYFHEADPGNRYLLELPS
ncbi:MAG: hypothetical protein JWO17_707 [Actinomycetia bacterium]|nr:hypothetical protein [Actinomycetes bacterium]